MVFLEHTGLDILFTLNVGVSGPDM